MSQNMNHQQEHKDQSEQIVFPFMGIDPATPAEELLATLRQCFLLNSGRSEPMHILALVEDQYPETEKDCDSLRLSIRMANHMGWHRVRAMRVHHFGRIEQMVRGTLLKATLNS